MREFVVAAKNNEAAKREEQPSTPMKMDDGKVIHWAYPDSSTLLMLLNAIEGVTFDENGNAESPKAALEAGQVLLSAMHNLLGDADWRYIRRRIFDPEDPLDINDMMVNLQGVIEEDWSGYPTQPSSDSSPSQPSTGGKSTGNSKAKGSTRSRSGQTGS